MAVRKINIDDSEISVIFGLHDEDYICLTDMVKAGDNSDRTNIVIQNWMRRKDTISYLGVWEICTTLILKASNSMQLRMPPVPTVLS